MKKTNVITSFLVFYFLISGTLIAQIQLSVQGGFSFPTSEFGDDDFSDNDSGLAAPGIFAGLQFIYPLNQNGLGLFASADLHFNGILRDSKEDFEDLFNSSADITHFKYLNLPLIAGLEYWLRPNEQLALFGNLGIGPNFMKRTNLKVENGNNELKYRWDLATTLAFKISGGFVIQDKYKLGIIYTGLGEQRLKGEIEFDDGDTEDLDRARMSSSMISLMVGLVL